MSRDAFWHIHGLIEDDPVFASTPRRPQRPVKFQMAAFYMQVGGMTALRTGDIIGVAEGSSFLYFDRVSKALRRLKPQYLKWPDTTRRAVIKQWMEDKTFPGCIGIGDGSLLRLVHRPLKNPWSYWCRKKFYAVSFFLLCINIL